MDSRTLRTLFLIALGLLAPTHVDAATYKLPVRTATLAVGVDHYGEFADGLPVGPYEFCLDPPSLRVGYDPQSGLVYESAIVINWDEYPVIPEGTLVYAALHSTAVSPPSGAYAHMPEIPSPNHAGPSPSDFDWLSQYAGGGIICIFLGFDPDQPEVPVFGTGPVQRPPAQNGWVLTTAGDEAFPYFEIAGKNNALGLEAPYLLVTTVPEPSPALCLGAAVLVYGALIRAGRRRRSGLHVLAAASIAVLLAGVALADDPVDIELNSQPAGASGQTPSMPIYTVPPPGSVYLPTVSRLWWTDGCMPTSGAMAAGYYDNSGFKDICRKRTWNPDGFTDYLFPTGNYPNDNGCFLIGWPDFDEEGDDDPYVYPSRCDVIATETGVFGRPDDDQHRGHVDDYYVCLQGTTGCTGYNTDPYYANSWTPHPDDCIADFVGNSIYRWRFCSDGKSWIKPKIATSPNDWQTGAQSRWVPPWYNTSVPPSNLAYGYANYNAGQWRSIDATWGLAQYIAVHAGYQCCTGEAENEDEFPDIAEYYNQAILGYFTSNDGVEESDMVGWIDEGWPMIALLNQVNPNNHYWETGVQHACLVFGYIPGDPLRLLLYDTWNEDCLTQFRHRPSV